MKKSLLTTFLFLFSILLTVAAPVDEQTARKIASEFMLSKMPATRSASGDITRAVTGLADNADAGIYVFNSDNAFVIISGNDNTPSVLGYSDNGAFDVDKVPEGLKAMISWFQKSVSNYQPSTRGEVSKHDEIKVLLKTKWNQRGPYNLTCPYDSENKATSVTGCAATALAQVMNYFQWPSTYEWSKMKNDYASTDSTDAAYAVAKLMRDAGDALFMEYSANGSSSSTLAPTEALRNSFSYSYSTELAEREHYTAKEWDELIYGNLAAGKPVFYSGQAIDLDSSDDAIKGVQAGHAFVVDGYDGDGLYHVNWGWGGMSNGYFLLSLLNPSNQGIGGGSGSEGYGFVQAAVVNITKSETANTTDYRLYSRNFVIKDNKTVINRSTTSDNFPSFQASSVFANWLEPTKNRKFDIGFALYKGDALQSVLYSGTFDFEANAGYIFTSDAIKFGKNVADGTYQLRPVCRENGKEDWVLSLGGFDCYVDMVVNGTTLTFAQHGAENDNASSFVVNSKDYTTDNHVGRPITIKLNLTDKNKGGNSPVFLWGNEDSATTVLLAGVGSNLDSGETGDVTIHYTPQREGSYKFYISGSTSDYSAAFDSIEVNVAARLVFDVLVDVDYDVEGADADRKVEGTTLKGNIKIKNNSSEDYYDPVLVYLYKNKVGTNSFSSVNYNLRSSEIKVGETVEVPFLFEDLETETNYALLIYMVENTKLKWVNCITEGETQYITRNSVFTLVSSTGIENIQLDAPDADVYNLNGVRIGKASGLKSLPKGVYIINKKKIINK